MTDIKTIRELLKYIKDKKLKDEKFLYHGILLENFSKEELITIIGYHIYKKYKNLDEYDKDMNYAFNQYVQSR